MLSRAAHSVGNPGTRFRPQSPPTGAVASTPSWLDSVLFIVLMSGPPKFRDRDPFASLEGAIDVIVLVHAAVWACGALWVTARLYSSVLRRGVVPAINAVEGVAALLIAALSLSLWDSPGFLLTAFVLGQFAVTLTFVWLFAHQFGPTACLRHLFGGVLTLALAIVVAVYFDPYMVIRGPRLLGENIAPAGAVAVLGLVFCLSGVPRLKSPLLFWAALGLFGGLLIMARTRSAYVALAAYVAIGFVYGKRLPVRKFVIPFAALVLSLFVMDTVSSTTDYLVREHETVQSMSDRIPLWQHLGGTVMRDAPLVGLGYYAASRVLGPQYNPALGDAHSVFFEILVGGGLLSVAPYLVLCALLVWFGVRLLMVAGGEAHTLAAVGLLSVTLVLGITSSQALQPGPLGFCFWSLTALLPAMWRANMRARALSQPRWPERVASQRVG
jgi:O-antigen ligase/polysaccharide polymerase Wzy-like membrane protein